MRWTFYDPTTLETAIFEINPNEGGLPQRRRSAVNSTFTTAPSGRVILQEGPDTLPTLEFSGTILNQSMYNMVVDWFSRNHLIQMTDDNERTYRLYITDLTGKRVRSHTYDYKITYTVKARIAAITASQATILDVGNGSDSVVASLSFSRTAVDVAGGTDSESAISYNTTDSAGGADAASRILALIDRTTTDAAGGSDSASSSSGYSGAVLADSPYAYYRLGEASGTTAADYSGNGHPLTHNNSPTVGVTGLLTTDSDLAVFYANLQYSTSSNFIANNTTFTTWTLECLAKPTSTTGTMTLVGLSDGDIGMYFSGTQIRVLYRGVSGTNRQLFTNSGNPTVTIGTTYHLAATCDGNTLSIYVNGVLKKSQAFGEGAKTQNTLVGMRVSSSSSGFSALATVDEYAFYTTSLSATRIAAHAALR